MANSDKPAYTEATLAAYDRLISTLPGIERRGAAMPYTSLNGNMFSFIDKDGGLSIRLSKQDRTDFLAQYPNSLSLQHGVVMKEYVLLPQALFAKPHELQSWWEKSHAYAQTLKPKRTSG